MASPTFYKRIALNTVSSLSSVWKGFATMATNGKIPRIIKKIGTHDGVFHCDEALACFMLQQLPAYTDADIIRTRDPSVLETCDIVVDVGSEYNPKTHHYDHHQRDFKHTLSSVCPALAKNKMIKLSSAGLVYAHFGLEVITEILNRHKITATTDFLECIYIFIYDGFVEELDAIDNGVPMLSEGKPKYRINTHLSARVHRLNPKWNSPCEVSVNEQFYKAMDLVGKEFTEKVMDAATIWWPARKVVKECMEKRKEVHQSGQILLLETRCPWTEHLSTLESELDIPGEIKFCIFQDHASWRVQGIPIEPDSFICRVFLHNDWRGLRDDELSKISGIENSIFCHSNGFIGGNKTREGAIEMALKSLLTMPDRD